MPYSLLVDQRVYRWLRKAKLPSKHYRQIVLRIFELGVAPRPQDCIVLKGGYRVTSGEYRIYYEVDSDARTVYVLLAGHRNDDEFYRMLDRLIG